MRKELKGILDRLSEEDDTSGTSFEVGALFGFLLALVATQEGGCFGLKIMDEMLEELERTREKIHDNEKTRVLIHLLDNTIRVMKDKDLVGRTYSKSVGGEQPPRDWKLVDLKNGEIMEEDF